jgi:hypothetical protein
MNIRLEKKKTMTRLEYLFNQYGNILDWYKQAETKSSFLVTVNTLVVGVVNGLVFVGVDKVSHVKNIYSVAIWILLSMCGLSLVGSYLFILRAVWARHHREAAKNLTDKEKLWFFGHLASMSRDQHKTLLNQFSEEHLEATMSAQNFILSHNVNTKYNSLNFAISLTIISVILLFALGIAYAIAVAQSSLPSTGPVGG